MILYFVFVSLQIAFYDLVQACQSLSISIWRRRDGEA